MESDSLITIDIFLNSIRKKIYATFEHFSGSAKISSLRKEELLEDRKQGNASRRGHRFYSEITFNQKSIAITKMQTN